MLLAKQILSTFYETKCLLEQYSHIYLSPKQRRNQMRIGWTRWTESCAFIDSYTSTRGGYTQIILELDEQRVCFTLIFDITFRSFSFLGLWPHSPVTPLPPGPNCYVNASRSQVIPAGEPFWVDSCTKCRCHDGQDAGYWEGNRLATCSRLKNCAGEQPSAQMNWLTASAEKQLSLWNAQSHPDDFLPPHPPSLRPGWTLPCSSNLSSGTARHRE